MSIQLRPTSAPHPKALAAGAEGSRKETNEVAVMVDAADALKIAPLAHAIEWEGYVDSWKE